VKRHGAQFEGDSDHDEHETEDDRETLHGQQLTREAYDVEIERARLSINDRHAVVMRTGGDGAPARSNFIAASAAGAANRDRKR